MLYIARAALSIENCNEEEISRRIFETVHLFCKNNKIKYANLASIIFSQTTDITHINPAQMLRRFEGFSNVALFCTQEPHISEQIITSEKVEYKTDNSKLVQVVRMLIFFNKFNMFFKPSPIYIYGAEKLRPDLFDSL